MGSGLTDLSDSVFIFCPAGGQTVAELGACEKSSMNLRYHEGRERKKTSLHIALLQKMVGDEEEHTD